MSRTTVAVTGASGFVGKQLLRSLLESGCAVRAIVRDPSSVQIPPDADLDVIAVPDLFSAPPELLERLVDGTEILIHAAWYAEPGKYLTSPVNLTCLTGTLNLASAFANVGGRRFVGLGTCAEYDVSAGLLTTQTPLLPKTLYAACKASTYLVLSNLLAEQEFAWCRLFYLYGAGEDARRLVPYIRSQLEAGQEVLLTRGDQVRDFLDVGDAAQMIVRAALSSDQGAVNICSGQGITIRELAERIADEYGRRDLLRFGARADNAFDPPRVVGLPYGA